MNYLKSINWVDIFVVILLTRICYVAVKTGLPTEIFKLLGTICAIYLACHYYIRVSNFLNNYLHLKGEGGVDFLNFLAFLALASLGYFIFVIIRGVFVKLIRMEAVSLLNSWGSFILGIGRFCLFASLLFFILTISNIGYLKHSLTDSFSGPKLFKLAPKVYTSLWDNLMSRFIDKEAFNKSILEVQSSPPE